MTSLGLLLYYKELCLEVWENKPVGENVIYPDIQKTGDVFSYNTSLDNFHAGAGKVQIRHKEELPACQGVFEMKVSEQRVLMKFLSLQKKDKHWCLWVGSNQSYLKRGILRVHFEVFQESSHHFHFSPQVLRSKKPNLLISPPSVLCLCSHSHLQIAKCVLIFSGRGEGEGKLMGVPVSPSGQDSLCIRTRLLSQNQGNLEGRQSLSFGLWISLYSLGFCTRERVSLLIMWVEQLWGLCECEMLSCPETVPHCSPKLCTQLSLWPTFLPKSPNLLMTQFLSQSQQGEGPDQKLCPNAFPHISHWEMNYEDFFPLKKKKWKWLAPVWMSFHQHTSRLLFHSTAGSLSEDLAGWGGMAWSLWGGREELG